MAWLTRLTRCVMRQLGLEGAGTFSIAFIDAEAMRRLNRRFLRHDALTDVLSFRYAGEPVVGEIVVAPAFARKAAGWYRTSYRQELGRYVIHGLLHWKGYEDRTSRQQRIMRAMEDQLLAQCQESAGRRQATGDRGRATGLRSLPGR